MKLPIKKKSPASKEKKQRTDRVIRKEEQQEDLELRRRYR